MKYTETELNKLIEDVEKEFTAHLTKSETVVTTPVALAKAEDEEKKEEKKPEDHKEESEPKHEGEEKHEEPKHEEKHEGEEHSEKHSEEKHSEEKHEEPKHGDEDGCDYDEEDHAHMHNMYLSMKKGELKAHHDAVKKALDHHGLEKCGDMSMAKSETTTVVVPETVKTNEIELAKSEVAAQKAKYDELKKNFDAVSEFVTKLVKKTVPQGKAITSMDVIAKSEATPDEKTLSKSEITAILNKKAQDSSLSKSDREAINNFYLGDGSLTKISHLLK